MRAQNYIHPNFGRPIDRRLRVIMISSAAAGQTLGAGARPLSNPKAPLPRRLYAARSLLQQQWSAQNTRQLQRGRVVQASSSSASTATEGLVQESMHTLPDSMRVEVLHLPAQRTPATPRPPLLFLHGSYHGAWCWRENFMPYFSAAGYDCYAVSIRGQGASERGSLKVSGTIKSIADDLASFIATLPSPPVLLGHSFGGIVVERYLLDIPNGNPALAGIACLASVPPTGNYDIVIRVTKKSLIDAWKITWAFVGKSFAKSLDDCRYTFFSPDLPQEKLERYQKQLAACSPVRMLDLAALRKDVPLPPPPASLSSLPAYVGGGDSDIVVDLPAVEELAAWLGVQPVIWKGVAHDCMLDTRWEEVAGSLRRWLDEVPKV